MVPKLFFPCINFTVSGVVTASEGVSPIETEFLRAISIGMVRLEDLQNFFGLKLRMSMEIINRLLRRNLVIADFRQGSLHLPHSVQLWLAQRESPEPPSLGGSDRPQPREFRLCLNQLTGVVTGWRYLHVRSLDDDFFQVPGVTAPVSLANVDELTVELAAAALVRREGLYLKDLDFDSRTPRADGGISATAVATEWGNDGEEASVSLQCDGRQRVAVSEVIELEALLLSSRSDPARRWIWEKLDPRRVAAAGVSSAAPGLLPSSLWSVAAKLEASGTSLMRRGETAKYLADAVETLETTAHVQVHDGPEASIAAVADCLKKASRQGVVVAPFLAAGPTTEILKAKAAESRWIVLHGIDRSPIDADMLQCLEGHAATSDIGAEVHAKVAIADGRACVVGSKNFLSSGSASELWDVMLTLEGSEIVAAMLEWAKSIAHEKVVRHGRWRLSELPAEAQRRFFHALPEPESSGASIPAIRQAIVGLLEGHLSGLALVHGIASGVHSWLLEASRGLRDETDVAVKDVAEFLRFVAERAEGIGFAPWMLVRTEHHRPLLFDALSEASRYVVVTSHHLGPQALGPNLQRAVAQALARGVNVVLVWGAEKEQGESEEQELVSALRQLADGKSGQLVVNQSPVRTHCKLLLVDGMSCVVSSYEFLNLITRPGYARHELGVWLGSRTVTGQLLAGLLRHINTVSPDLARQVREAVH